MNNTISYTDFQKTSSYAEFLRQNPAFGSLKIIASTASSALPVSDAEVVVSRDVGNYHVIFFRGKTDSSGVIEEILLPCPSGFSMGSLEVPEYAIYSMDVTHSGYQDILGYSVGIFNDIKVIQTIVMNPIIQIEKNV